MADESSMLSPAAGEDMDVDTQLATACEQYFSQKIEFRLATKGDSHLEQLRSIYQPLNKMVSPTNTENTKNAEVTKQAWTDGIPEPKVVLFDPTKLQLTWKQPRSIGAALVNVGNTCFFNSVIQCLTYTPPIISYFYSGDHAEKCRIQGFCALCEFRQHCLKALSASSSVIQPKLVYHLKAIGKNFRLGRQEDAHEFLRYFVDALQQCCLKLHCSPEKLDAFSKATTVIHQIFGGFHRSRVVCLECKKVSDTYDPLLDISLDINFCSTLTKALQHSTKADLLDGKNRYACPHCKKMTNAHKMFTVHRPPNVLTIHLKRFDFSRGLGVKLGTSIDYGEYLDIRPYTSDKSGPPLWYRLYAVVEHLGFSAHSGHYICYVRNSNGIWYCMNDAKVSQTSINNILRREAYLLFYIRDLDYVAAGKGSPTTKPISTTVQGAKVRDDANFLGTAHKLPGLGTPFKPSGLAPLKPPGLATPLTKSKLIRPMGVVSPSPTIQHCSIPLLKAKVDKSHLFNQTLKNYVCENSTVTAKDGVPETLPSTMAAKDGVPETLPSTMAAKDGVPGTLPSTMAAKDGVPETLPSTMAAKDGVPETLPSTMAAKDGVPETLPSTMAVKDGVPGTLPSTMAAKDGVPGTLPTTMAAKDGVPRLGACSVPSGCGAVITAGPHIQATQELGVADKEKTYSCPAGATVHANGDVTTDASIATPNEPQCIPLAHSAAVGTSAGSSTLQEKLSPSSERPHCCDFYTPTKSGKIAMVPPQVAMVSPQPHVSTKPVARVLPNPKPLPPDTSDHSQLTTQVTSGDSSDSSGEGEGEGQTTTTSNNAAIPHTKASETGATCSLTPYGPALPKDYNGGAVAKPLSPSDSPTSRRADSTTSSLKKLKKRKKKKKLRRKRNNSCSAGEHSDSEGVSQETESCGDTHRKKQSKLQPLGVSANGQCRYPPSGAEEGSGGWVIKDDQCYSKSDQSKKHVKSKHLSDNSTSISSGSELRSKKKHKSSKGHQGDSRDVPSKEHQGDSRDVPSKEHQRDSRDVPSKEHQRDSRDVPLKEHQGSRDVPSKEHQRDSRDVPSKEHQGDSRDVPLKEHQGSRDVPSKEHQGDSRDVHKAKVPIVEWDASLDSRPKGQEAKWDGCHQSDVVEKLIAHSHSKLGSVVKSWDGGDNSIDSSLSDRHRLKRSRDGWDEEMDKGKIKKVKSGHQKDESWKGSKNAFQEFQNRKSSHNDHLKSPFHRHHHKHIHHHMF